MAGGQVHLLVLPNAERFHTELKAKIESKKIKPVKVPIDLDNTEWKLFEDEVDRMDGRHVNLKVKIDDKDMQRALHDLNNSTETITRKLEIDDQEAQRTLDRLYSTENESDAIKKYLILDHTHADDAMKDFIKKWGSQKLPMPEYDTKNQFGDTRTKARKISGVRNLVDVESDLIDIENMLPRMFKSMNAQFSLGIRQLYDPYVNMVANMTKVSAKPFQAFSESWREAKTLEDFFKRVGKQADDSGSKIKKFSSIIGKGVKGSFTEPLASMRQFGKSMVSIPRVVGEEWRMMRGHVKNFGLPKINNKNIKEAIAGIKEVLDIFPMMASETKKMGGILKDAIANKVSRSFGVAKKAASEFGFQTKVALFGLKEDAAEAVSKLSVVGRSIGRHLGKGLEGASGYIQSRFRAWASLLPATMSQSLQRGAGRMWHGLASSARIAMLDISKTFSTAKRYLGPAMLGGLHAASRGISRFGKNSVATLSRSFSRAGRAVTGAFRGVGSYFGRMNKTIFRPLLGFAGRLAGRMRGATSAIGRLFGPLLRSKMVFRVMQMGVRRFGQMAVGASRVAIGAFGKLTGTLMGALVPALGAVMVGIMAMGGQAAIGAIMALGGAIQSALVGALVMLPAAIGAAGAAFAVLKIGTKGLKEGLSAAFSAESAEDFQKAIEKLPPAMQNIAKAARGFKPMMDEMKKNIQNNMFQGLDDNFASAIGSLLPIFKSGAEKMASSWNKAFEGALNALSSPQAIAGTQAIMDGTVEMSKQMEPFLANMTKAFGSLAEQGAKFLGPLGGYLNQQAEAFFNWSEGLKNIDPKTGETYFDGIIKSAKKNAGYLSDIFGGAFGTLGNVFKAGAQGGAGMLEGMAGGMQRLKEYTSEGNKGFEQMVGFMKQSTEFARQLSDAIAPAFGAIVSVMTTLASVGSGAMPGVAEVLKSIQNGVSGFEGIATKFGENIGAIIGRFAPLVESVLVTLQPIIDGIGDGLFAALDGPLKALEPVFKSLESLGQPIGQLFQVLGVALGKIFTAAVPIFSSVLALVGPLIPLLERVFFWVGEVIAKVLEIIQPIFTLRDNAVAGLLAQLGPLVDIIGNGLMSVLNALAPLFPMLGNLFGELISAVTPLVPIIGEALKRAFDLLVGAINWVLPILPPLINIIVHVAKVIVEILVEAIKFLIRTWDAVWPAIQTTMNFLVNSVVVPLIKFLVEYWKILANSISWVIREIIVPILNEMSDVTKKVFDFIAWVIDNIFRPAVDTMVNLFVAAVDRVKAIWDGIKKVFSDPIRFFIETVINKGVVGAWNKVMGFIKKEDEWGMQEVPVPSGLSFYSGGVLPGMSVGKDNYNFIDPRTGVRLGLAGGEGIMRQEFVSAVGGKKGIDKLNEDARHGRLNRVERHSRADAAYAHGGVIDLGGLAAGGIVEAMKAIVQKKYPMLTMTSGLDNRPGYHGMGMAADFSNGAGNTPEQLALAQDIASTYPGSIELIYDAPGWSGNIKNGQNVGAFGEYYTMGQAGPHHHHVHWAMAEPPTMDFGGGVFQGMVNAAGAAIGRGFNWLADKTEKVTSAFGGISKDFGFFDQFGQYGKLGLGIAEGVVDKVKESAMAKIKEMAPRFGGSGAGLGLNGPNADWEPGAGAEQWRDMLIEAFKNQGEEPRQDLVDALVRQIHTESGGDPNIAQQIVDINGTGESAGVGLSQVIPGTWAGYRDPSLPDNRRDPWAHTNFMVRYFRDKHNWDTSFVGVGHGWSKGGVLPRFFDQGGIANGIGHLMKNTLRPERVLSPDQTAAFNDFVYRFMPELINEFKNNPRDIKRHVGKLVGEIQRIHHELREGHITRLQTKMADTFTRRLNGENLQDRPIDLNLDAGWLSRNLGNLNENRMRAGAAAHDALVDPFAYLEAENRAKEQIEKEKEAAEQARKDAEKEAAKQAKEDTKRAKQDLEDDRKELVKKSERDGQDRSAEIAAIDAKLEEVNANGATDYESEKNRIDTEKKRLKEEKTAELKAQKEALAKERDEAVKKAKEDSEKNSIKNDYADKIDEIDDSIKNVERSVDDGFDGELKALDEAKKAEDEAQRKREQEEKKRIEEAKADGSYYYGYEVFNDEGKRAKEYEETPAETGMKDFLSSVGERTGLGETMSGLIKRYDNVSAIGRAAQVATPAWMAALNGDPSGLAHNIAAGQAQVISQSSKSLMDLGPEALAGIIEMAIANSGSSAPLVENMYSGMTKAETIQTMEYFSAKRGRKGTGTTRVR